MGLLFSVYSLAFPLNIIPLQSFSHMISHLYGCGWLFEVWEGKGQKQFTNESRENNLILHDALSAMTADKPYR